MSTSFLNKYKIIQKIGEGSFSEVMKCEDKETKICYAAKRLKKKFKTMTDVSECAEIIAMQKLSRHPNILYMIEFHYDPHQGKVTFIFELMDMSMYDYMKLRKGKCFSESKVKKFLYQILKGLDHLHKNGLFHRDIKPENILVKVPLDGLYSQSKSEVIKLADLGSIRGVYSRPPYTEYISTRWYRSPECLLTTGYYGPKMDVWAAGCVFYEMLTLKPLFPGSNEVDQLAKIHAVLGTPNSRLLNKFRKHQSRNCENFPKQQGSGFGPLASNISEEGQQLLQVTVTYDPETRYNVRRVLEHRYFSYLRDEDAIIAKRPKRSYSININAKSQGDWKSRSNSSNIMRSSDPVEQAKQFHSLSSELGKSVYEKQANGDEDDDNNHHHHHHHHHRYHHPKPTRNNRPIDPRISALTKKLMNTWGIDTNILKNRSRDSDHRRRSSSLKSGSRYEQPHKKISSTNEVAKRRSDPAQHSTVKHQTTGTLATSGSSQKMTSKSFVLPRRLSAKSQLAPINEFPVSKAGSDFLPDIQTSVGVKHAASGGAGGGGGVGGGGGGGGGGVGTAMGGGSGSGGGTKHHHKAVMPRRDHQMKIFEYDSSRHQNFY